MINVGILWIIYIAVVLLIFFFSGYWNGMSFNGKWWVNAFFALLIGAIVVFVLTPFVAINTQTDRNWLGALLLVAYILPLVAALFMIWSMYWGCGCPVASPRSESMASPCPTNGRRTLSPRTPVERVTTTRTSVIRV